MIWLIRRVWSNKNKEAELLYQGLQRLKEDGLFPNNVDTADRASWGSVEPLLRLSIQLSKTWAVEPRREFKAAARGRFLNAAAAELSGKRRVVGFPSLRPVAVSLALAFVALAMTSFGIGAASASSLPGDLLYPVKLGIEQAELALARDEESKVALQLQRAQRRTDEISALDQRGRPVTTKALTALIQDTDKAISSVAESANESVAERLGQLASHQQEVLSRVAESAPAASKDALNHAKEVSQRGLERAQEAVGKARERGGNADGNKRGEQGVGAPPNASPTTQAGPARERRDDRGGVAVSTPTRDKEERDRPGRGNENERERDREAPATPGAGRGHAQQQDRDGVAPDATPVANTEREERGGRGEHDTGGGRSQAATGGGQERENVKDKEEEKGRRDQGPSVGAGGPDGRGRGRATTSPAQGNHGVGAERERGSRGDDGGSGGPVVGRSRE